MQFVNEQERSGNIYIWGWESRNIYFGKVVRLPELHFFPYQAWQNHKGKSANCKSTILICLSAFSFDWRVNLPKLVKFNPRGGLMVTALDSSVLALAMDIVLCAWPWLYTLNMPLSILTHRVGSWLKAFLWLSIDHRLNDTISIDCYYFLMHLSDPES